MRKILHDDLGVCYGDTILVHCGFGFLNASFSPAELVNLLQEVVGKNGNIIMPVYPPGLSSDWVKSGRIFRVETTKPSTGVLSKIFSKFDDVFISNHPIKAVAAWGKDAQYLISKHENSSYPYDDKSPYYKLSMMSGSKSIGLGVRNCAIMHCAEDLFESDKNTCTQINFRVLK